MNLHQLVRNAIATINPETKVAIKRFSGYTVNEYGEIVNSYEDYNPDIAQAITIQTTAQIQPVFDEKLEHINNYNSSNIYAKMFINGEEHGLSEALNTNGDLVIIDNKIWKIVSVVGLWKKSGWNEVIICLQDDQLKDYSYGE